jgi:hypothetical protein
VRHSYEALRKNIEAAYAAAGGGRS